MKNMKKIVKQGSIGTLAIGTVAASAVAGALITINQNEASKRKNILNLRENALAQLLFDEVKLDINGNVIGGDNKNSQISNAPLTSIDDIIKQIRIENSKIRAEILNPNNTTKKQFDDILSVYRKDVKNTLSINLSTLIEDKPENKHQHEALISIINSVDTNDKVRTENVIKTSEKTLMKSIEEDEDDANKKAAFDYLDKFDANNIIGLNLNELPTDKTNDSPSLDVLLNDITLTITNRDDDKGTMTIELTTTRGKDRPQTSHKYIIIDKFMNKSQINARNLEHAKDLFDSFEWDLNTIINRNIIPTDNKKDVENLITSNSNISIKSSEYNDKLGKIILNVESKVVDQIYSKVIELEGFENIQKLLNKQYDGILDKLIFSDNMNNKESTTYDNIETSLENINNELTATELNDLVKEYNTQLHNAYVEDLLDQILSNITNTDEDVLKLSTIDTNLISTQNIELAQNIDTILKPWNQNGLLDLYLNLDNIIQNDIAGSIDMDIILIDRHTNIKSIINKHIEVMSIIKIENKLLEESKNDVLNELRKMLSVTDLQSLNDEDKSLWNKYESKINRASNTKALIDIYNEIKHDYNNNIQSVKTFLVSENIINIHKEKYASDNINNTPKIATLEKGVTVEILSTNDDLGNMVIRLTKHTHFKDVVIERTIQGFHTKGDQLSNDMSISRGILDSYNILDLKRVNRVDKNKLDISKILPSSVFNLVFDKFTVLGLNPIDDKGELIVQLGYKTGLMTNYLTKRVVLTRFNTPTNIGNLEKDNILKMNQDLFNTNQQFDMLWKLFNTFNNKTDIDNLFNGIGELTTTKVTDYDINNISINPNIYNSLVNKDLKLSIEKVTQDETKSELYIDIKCETPYTHFIFRSTLHFQTQDEKDTIYIQNVLDNIQLSDLRYPHLDLSNINLKPELYLPSEIVEKYNSESNHITGHEMSIIGWDRLLDDIWPKDANFNNNYTRIGMMSYELINPNDEKGSLDIKIIYKVGNITLDKTFHIGDLLNKTLNDSIKSSLIELNDFISTNITHLLVEGFNIHKLPTDSSQRINLLSTISTFKNIQLHILNKTDADEKGIMTIQASLTTTIHDTLGDYNITVYKYFDITGFLDNTKQLKINAEQKILDTIGESNLSYDGKTLDKNQLPSNLDITKFTIVDANNLIINNKQNIKISGVNQDSVGDLVLTLSENVEGVDISATITIHNFLTTDQKSDHDKVHQKLWGVDGKLEWLTSKFIDDKHISIDSNTNPSIYNLNNILVNDKDIKITSITPDDTAGKLKLTLSYTLNNYTETREIELQLLTLQQHNDYKSAKKYIESLTNEDVKTHLTGVDYTKSPESNKTTIQYLIDGKNLITDFPITAESANDNSNGILKIWLTKEVGDQKYSKIFTICGFATQTDIQNKEQADTLLNNLTLNDILEPDHKDTLASLITNLTFKTSQNPDIKINTQADDSKGELHVSLSVTIGKQTSTKDNLGIITGFLNTTQYNAKLAAIDQLNSLTYKDICTKEHGNTITNFNTLNLSDLSIDDVINNDLFKNNGGYFYITGWGNKPVTYEPTYTVDRQNNTITLHITYAYDGDLASGKTVSRDLVLSGFKTITTLDTTRDYIIYKPIITYNDTSNTTLSTYDEYNTGRLGTLTFNNTLSKGYNVEISTDLGHTWEELNDTNSKNIKLFSKIFYRFVAKNSDYVLDKEVDSTHFIISGDFIRTIGDTQNNDDSDDIFGGKGDHNTRFTMPINFELPEGIEKIQSQAFRNKILPTGFKIPMSVTYIGHKVFRDTKFANDFTLKNNTKLIELGVEAFGSSTIEDSKTFGLPEGFELPNSLQIIGVSAFQGRYLPLSFKIPPSVTTIKYYAFLQATFYEGFEIPTTVKTMGVENTGLAPIQQFNTFRDTNLTWVDIDGKSKYVVELQPGWVVVNKNIFDKINSIKPYQIGTNNYDIGLQNPQITLTDFINTTQNRTFWYQNSGRRDDNYIITFNPNVDVDYTNNKITLHVKYKYGNNPDRYISGDIEINTFIWIMQPILAHTLNISKEIEWLIKNNPIPKDNLLLNSLAIGLTWLAYMEANHTFIPTMKDPFLKMYSITASIERYIQSNPNEQITTFINKYKTVYEELFK